MVRTVRRMAEESCDENKAQGTGTEFQSSQSEQTNMATTCHIRKNLLALRQFPRVALNNIRDLPEAFQQVGVFQTL